MIVSKQTVMNKKEMKDKKTQFFNEEKEGIQNEKYASLEQQMMSVGPEYLVDNDENVFH